MPVLVTGIHACIQVVAPKKDVDARVKPAHDGNEAALTSSEQWLCG